MTELLMLPPLGPMRPPSDRVNKLLTPLWTAALDLVRVIRLHRENGSRWHLDRLPTWLQGRGDPERYVYDKVIAGIFNEGGVLQSPDVYRRTLKWLRQQPIKIEAARRD